MSQVEWSPRFRVGVPDMDAQHERLVALHNRLDAALRGGEDPARAPDRLQDLLDAAGRHFACEEALMARVGHDGLAEHRAEHALYLQKARRFLDAWDPDRPRASLPLLEFLGYWLEDHITVHDSRYRRALKGVSLDPAEDYFDSVILT